ncbi:MAG: hypothetical protein KGO82_13560 [Bacteroidota bacterium]|nr:hypothetical protein [Bacteroidota bacterium]
MEPVLRKPYWAPARWMLIIAFIRSVLIGISMWSSYIVQQRYPKVKFHNSFTPDILLVLIILVEAYAYVIFRNYLYKKQWAIIHVWLTGIAAAILPLLLMIFAMTLPLTVVSPPAYRLLRWIGPARWFLVTALLVTGNVFFALNLRKSWSKGLQREQDDIDAIGSQQ